MTPTDQLSTAVPPSNTTGPNQVQSAATGLAAAVSTFGGLAASDKPVGKVNVRFEAAGADAFVRFGPATSAATTAATGLIVKAGDYGRVFTMDPDKHAFMDVFAAAAGTIKWQVCSPPGTRNRQ